MEELIKILVQNISTLVGLCVLGVVIAFIKKAKSQLVDEILSVIKHGNSKAYKSKMHESIKCDSNIYKELSRVLFSVNGSRIGLYQFHNGNVFSTNNPIWKISNTHEICENGVSTEIEKVQDMKSSLFTPIILPIVDSVDSDGVTRVDPCQCQLEDTMCSSRGIYRVDPDKMMNSYIHAILLERNVKFALMAPIINTYNQVTGFTMLEFCQDGHMSKEELARTAKMLCETTSIIALILGAIESDN